MSRRVQMSPAAWTEIVTNIGIALSDIGDPDDVKRIVRVVIATCGIPITPDAVLAMEREAFPAGNTGDMTHMRATVICVRTLMCRITSDKSKAITIRHFCKVFTNRFDFPMLDAMGTVPPTSRIIGKYTTKLDRAIRMKLYTIDVDGEVPRPVPTNGAQLKVIYQKTWNWALDPEVVEVAAVYDMELQAAASSAPAAPVAPPTPFVPPTTFVNFSGTGHKLIEEIEAPIVVETPIVIEAPSVIEVVKPKTQAELDDDAFWLEILSNVEKDVVYAELMEMTIYVQQEPSVEQYYDAMSDVELDRMD